MLAAIMHVAFRLRLRPSEVLSMSKPEFALCLAYMRKEQIDVSTIADG